MTDSEQHHKVSQFQTTRLVEFHETDLAGIVHFSNFYRFMEQAEHEFFRFLDLGIMSHQPDGTTVAWPRVSANCSFKSPAYYQDLLTIDISVDRIGVKSLTTKYRFSRDGLLIAQGTLKTVCCIWERDKPLRSIEIPELYLNKIMEAPRE